MSLSKRIWCITLIASVWIAFSAHAQQAGAPTTNLQLSPGLMKLLRTEMRAILEGVQSMPADIATANWQGVAHTSAQISASYILDQELTPAQRKELQTSLPEHFKRLDGNFHEQARKLEAAARNHDAQLSAFHYYRMLESCTACHSHYAPNRFPGFAPASKGHHGH
jgi:cytochrome c556